MSRNLNIKKLTKKQLEEALEQNLYWGDDISLVPFSKSKARWLLKNERIKNDDVCAILSIENKNLVSFIFLIPDWIHTNNGMTKIFWSNRWWVHEKYKNSILSTYTQNFSLESTKNQVIIKFIGDDTIEYYKKQPFTEFSKKTRYIFVFGLEEQQILSRLSFLKFLTPLLKLISKSSNFLITKINANKTATKELQYKSVNVINDDEWRFIEKHTLNDLIPKSKNYINWQIDNSQYTNTKSTPYRCLVTSISRRIYNVNFFVIRNNEIIGFISSLVRDNEYITRYFLCDIENYNFCLDALMENFIKTQCIYLLVEDEGLGKKINNKFIKIYKNLKEQISLAHNDIDIDFKNKKVYQQDGHFA